MIKNIIFDLGRVLIDVTPERYLEHIGIKEEEIKLYKKMIWGSKDWAICDRGDISYEQATDNICKKNPKYSEKLRYILENKDNSFILKEYPRAYQYLEELKDKGYKIYFLSNVNQVDLKYDKENMNIFKLIDGAVYSSDVGFAKPELECYKILLNKYNLIAEECIFVDDSIDNVEAATSIGIKSILFYNLDDTKLKIQEIINK